MMICLNYLEILTSGVLPTRSKKAPEPFSSFLFSSFLKDRHNRSIVENGAVTNCNGRKKKGHRWVDWKSIGRERVTKTSRMRIAIEAPNRMKFHWV